MLSQLPMWVPGSEHGPAGQSSLLGIARPKQGAGVKGTPRGEVKGSEECPKLGLKREQSQPRVSRAFREALRGPRGLLGQQDTKQAQSWKGGPWPGLSELHPQSAWRAT